MGSRDQFALAVLIAGTVIVLWILQVVEALK